mmetsp:Transcript_33448/g.72374  ORF Transcript_33448/g.72374 Transcript_33448/m.72374 type:complete len:570 (-) Transcript_33448:1047-2756(-)
MMHLAVRILDIRCICFPISPTGSLLDEDSANVSSPCASFAPMTLIDDSDRDAPAAVVSERTELLRSVSVALDHHNTVTHDTEIDAGVCYHLLSILQDAVEDSFDSEEVFLSVDSLSKALRCSDAIAECLLVDIGTSLLQLLFRLVEMNYRLGNTALVASCRALIERWAALEMNLDSIDNHHILLPFLVGAVNGTSGKETVHCAALSLQRLSRPAANKAMMALTGGLLDCLFGLLQGCFPKEIRVEAAEAVKNLAWECVPNKNLIASSSWYIEVLATTTKDKDEKIRGAAIETLVHLSSASTAEKVSIVEVDGLINRLLQIAQDFTERPDLRVSATHALACLICRETATALGKYDNLLDVLRYLSCGGLNNAPAAIQAAMAIKKLVTCSEKDSEFNGALVQTIVAIASSKFCTQVLMWASRAIRQLTLDGDSYRTSTMVEAKGFFTTLTELCKHPHPNVQRPSLEALEALSVNHGGSALVVARSKDIMTMLVETALREGQIHDALARRLAVQTILALATDPPARRAIASQQDVFVDTLTALSTFGSSKDDDTELRQAASQGVALLAPLLL